jgi:transcriptional regulator with XRE-family HTH domain
VSSAVSLRQNRDKYPNNLREARNKAQITRVQLVGRCDALKIQDGVRYVQIGLGAIKFLEAGVRRPRLTTALTLAAALNTTIQALFPHGIDNPDRVSGL